MVLALVPTAFATATTSASSNDLKVEVTVTIDKDDIESIEICKANGWEETTGEDKVYKIFTATGKNPTVNVEVPYGMIDEIHGTGIWDSDVLDVLVKVSGLHYSWNQLDYKDNKITVTLDGKDVTEDIDFDDAPSSDAAKAENQAKIDKYNGQLNYIAQVTNALATDQAAGYDWHTYAKAVFNAYESYEIDEHEEYSIIVKEDEYTPANARATLIEDNEALRALIADKVAALEANKDSLGDVDSFTCNADLHQKSASYKYEFVLSGEKGDVTYKEYVNFTLSYTDTTKPVYDLKFGQPDTDGVELKDGVYFIDSAFDCYADEYDTEIPGWVAARYDLTNITSATINVFKNDGSKFTERAYYEINRYPVFGGTSTSRTVSDSQVTIYDPANNEDGKELELRNMGGAKQSFDVIVETEYAIYKGTVNIKYRKNVSRVDPKGVFFDKDEYTIGVNEVFTPSYTTTVPVWHDVASIVELSQTAYTEKGIIDCDGNKITGLREGVAYVVLTYDDKDGSVTSDGTGTPAYYTDTAKVTVKGTYQVLEKANYIVTTSSSNLNVRSGAGTKYSKIGSLAKGTVVEVVEIKDGWAKIIFPSTRYTNGYVSAQYLTKQSTSPETVIGTKTVIARVLNVRSGAGTSYSIVGKLNRNTKVEVIETVANGSWSKIKFNGGYAYVSSTYIQ